MAKKSSNQVDKQSRRKRQPKAEVVEEVEPVEEVLEEEIVCDEPVVQEVEVEQESSSSTSTKRSAPTRDSVLEEFAELLRELDEEIDRLKGSKNGNNGFLRRHRKRLSNLRASTQRVVKSGKKTTRTNNNNSGILKPVMLSPELIKFTGWDAKTPKSRVEVTRFLSEYIRKNDLQKAEDRRQIRPDRKLGKLLKYDEGSASKPLTYPSLQTYLKPHFLPVA